MKICVDLPDELVAVWAPVKARHSRDDLYQITEVNRDPEDTRLAFNTGAIVRRRPTRTRDGKETIRVAYEQAEPEHQEWHQSTQSE
jgi:hypothetical protein